MILFLLAGGNFNCQQWKQLNNLHKEKDGIKLDKRLKDWLACLSPSPKVILLKSFLPARPFLDFKSEIVCNFNVIILRQIPVMLPCKIMALIGTYLQLNEAHVYNFSYQQRYYNHNYFHYKHILSVFTCIWFIIL